MSGRGSDLPFGAAAAQAYGVRGQVLGVAGPAAARPIQISAVLAYVFMLTLPVPGLVNLPAGASLALVTMLLSIPVWYMAARARNTPFDPTATLAISIILPSAAFLIFWSFLSVFGAESPLRASRYITSLIAPFALYFMVRGTITRQRVILYVDVLTTVLAATAVMSLLAYKVDFLHQIIFQDTDRASGFFKNPNQFGMAISTTLPAVMALVLAERRRRRFRVACLLLLLLGLVASGSKTNLLLAWASTLVVLCGHSVIAHSGAKRFGMMALYLVGGLALAGLGAAALSLLNPRALGIMSEFLGSDGNINSLQTRSYLWAYSVDQFLNDPFFGEGAGQRINIFYREPEVSHSHNVLLDYMRTLGAPGLLGVSVMISAVVIVCLMSIGRTLRSQSGAAPTRIICFGLSLCCLNYVAANMSSDSFGPSTSPFFWLFAYLSFATRNLMRQRPSDAPKTRIASKRPVLPVQ